MLFATLLPSAAQETASAGTGTETEAVAQEIAASPILSGPRDFSAAGLSDWASEATSQLTDLAVAYAPRLLLAILVLVVGWIVVGYIKAAIRRVLGLKHIDPTVGNFLGSVAAMALKIMLLLSVAGMIGIEVTSFIAILSAATLAIGMALR